MPEVPYRIATTKERHARLDSEGANVMLARRRLTEWGAPLGLPPRSDGMFRLSVSRSRSKLAL
jgi:hypothetical protein